MAIHSPNFYSGPCMTPTLIALAALSVIFTFTATALHRCGALRLTPRQQTATRVSIKGSLIGSCLAIGLARFLDLRAAGHRSPAIPAAGAAASWAAALALVPVPKAMNPGRLLFGSGYERTIPYHTFMGNFIMFAGMVHGCLCVAQKRASMAATAAASSASTALIVAPTIAVASTTAAPSLSATVLAKIAKLPQSNLSGFISFLSFILIVLSSRKWIRTKFFATWRALHVSLTGSAYFFLVVHDPKTISLMLPVVAYYAADVVLRIVMSVLANAKVVAIVAHEDAQVVEVKIKLYGLVPALMVETDNTASSSSPESHEDVTSHAQPQPQSHTQQAESQSQRRSDCRAQEPQVMEPTLSWRKT